MGGISKWLVIGLFLSAMVGLAPVHAYILEGPHVLELVVDTLDKAQSLRVVQNVITVAHGADSDQTQVLEETLSYLFPERLRSETVSESGQRVQVVSFDQTLTIVDGKRTGDKVPRLDRYKALLLYRSRLLLHKMLLTYGVDVENSSLGRFEDKTILVVGAQYPDMSVSQVWVDKESFLPLRWLDIASPESNDRLAFVYRRWQKKGDVWYPLEVEIYHDDQLIRRIEVVDIDVNPVLPLELFDIPYLSTKYPLAEPAGPASPDGTNSADEVKRTIEEFQKKFDE